MKTTNLPTPSIPGSKFFTASAKQQKAIALIFGESGSGKTAVPIQFAPQPVFTLNFDERDGPPIERAKASGRVIHRAYLGVAASTYRKDEASIRKIGHDALCEVVHHIELATREVERGNCKTICVDTGTELTDIISMAITGSLDRKTNDFGKSSQLIGREWWQIYRLARESGAHFIVLAREKEIWVGQKPTGRFGASGSPIMREGADWAVRSFVRKKDGGNLYQLQVVKDGTAGTEIGSVYTSEEWEAIELGPFAYTCMNLYPGTDPSDWE